MKELVQTQLLRSHFMRIIAPFVLAVTLLGLAQDDSLHL
jgi:hypothetical protein